MPSLRQGIGAFGIDGVAFLGRHVFGCNKGVVRDHRRLFARPFGVEPVLEALDSMTMMSWLNDAYPTPESEL